MKHSTKWVSYHAIKPYLTLWRQHWQGMGLGVLLGVITLIASIGLLIVSGWFLTATALAGFSALMIKNFNFYTPAASVRFLAVARTAGRYFERIVTHQVTLTILTQIRIKIWQRLQGIATYQLRTLRKGDVLNRLLTDIDTLDQLYLRGLTPVAHYLILSCIAVLVLAWWSWTIALVLLLGLGAVGISLPWLGYQLFYSSRKLEQQAVVAYREQVFELLSTQTELTVAQAWKRKYQHLAEFEASLYQAQIRIVQRQGVLQALMIVLHGLVVIAAITGLANFVLTEQITGPIYAAIVIGSMALMEWLLPLMQSGGHIAASVLAAKRINELEDKSLALSYPDNTAVVKKGEIEFCNVEFGYHKDACLLDDFCLFIEAKGKYLIRGESGRGKTTLLNLIARIYDAHSGKVLLDGLDIKDYSEASLCQAITYIEQQAQIFSASLKDNLTLALADGGQVEDEILWQALKQVGLSYLADENGLSLWIGEGGRALSGGEKQRLSLARALLRDSPIVLLDEPTESFDSETEQHILNLIAEIFSEKTVLLVTHRELELSDYSVVRV
ncbi:thiol reductant ABC exporter subunit CydC [Parashewanella curva]|uniref:Thiol reductant ABC exporter subunit CydC n=1 Tax=Parashewanella curva TaxID=2338552 RepID=A0A3L8PV66_9GAMM|nr:thiol reductant ABC exporter subunit CydC [Parashewanella curva]RLV59240.1 thiol reductant ABC exporter subunit CydC [Parashewanella curva]